MTPTLDASATWAEIHGQPAVWEALSREPALGAARAWLAALAPREAWLMGAGTSAYVGEIVAAGLEGEGGPRLRAIPTTDLVSRPRDFLPPRAPGALVVQFGRSGDSTESLGVMDALDALSPETPRLHVTCNPEGQLAVRPAPGPLHVLRLPEAAHDRGFAMTSSFSGMLLAALALLSSEGAAPLEPLAARLNALLPIYEREVAAMPVPERLVFLGSGPLAFAAREASLKVMELARGAIPCLWESTLGFRHGPKSFVQGRTDVVLFASADPQSSPYEADLAAELRRQFPGSRILVLGPGGDLDLPGGGWADVAPRWAPALAVPFAQVLAAAISDRLGMRVDDPFEGAGTLSRVVSGVRLHPVRP
jgi:tagatose-6-phosphate ketose/aldose isomerase